MIVEKGTQNGKATVLGLQYLLTIYAGAVAVPPLISTGLGFNQEQMTYLISIDIFICGLAASLQLTVNRFFGIGLPVILGCAIQAVAPLILIGTDEGIGAIYGSIIASGIFIVLVSGIFSKIKKLFPPLITGAVITVIGLTLIPVAIEKIGGGNTTAADFGDKTDLLFTFVTILLIVGMQMLTKGFIHSIAMLTGSVGGNILAAFMGVIGLNAIGDAPLFHVPQPFYFGKPTFDIWSTLLVIIISMVSMVESAGIYLVLGDITGKGVGEEGLKKGYRTGGLAIISGGIFNTFPYMGFSQDVGLVQLSGIRARKPIYFSAFFLIVLRLFPRIGALARIIPEPVLDRGMLVVFGMMAVQGIRMLLEANFSDDRNLLIVTVSVGSGLDLNITPTLFNQMPQTLQMSTGNNIVMSSITAIILNLIFNGLKKDKEIVEEAFRK